ncbi:hypothetical protein CXF95_23425 [Paraglaciecola sp. MB-3u-78]|jgi:hypothetical protein|nr:hypothetical protein CXF95_26480 [Paraglaciecola sp. MB-3u-78]PKG96764.1 hypothetical protein CXF95_23425 [Paraglaciecola sp. MB-3u-78]
MMKKTVYPTSSKPDQDTDNNPNGCFKGDKVRSSSEASVDKTNANKEPEYMSELTTFRLPSTQRTSGNTRLKESFMLKISAKGQVVS